MSDTISLEVIDIHARRGLKESKLVEGAPPVEVTIWEIVCVLKGVDTNYQFAISTTDSKVAAKYKIGGTVELKLWYKGIGLPVEAEQNVVQMQFPTDDSISIMVEDGVQVSESLE